MMRNFNARLRRLEESTSDQSIVAVAEDGQHIRIKSTDLLPMTTAAFRAKYAEIMEEPVPQSRFDHKLDLFRRVALRSAAPLVEVISSVLRREP